MVGRHPEPGSLVLKGRYFAQPWLSTSSPPRSGPSSRQRCFAWALRRGREFLDHDAVVKALWRFLYELAPDYQFALLDEQTNSLAAMGNCIPIRWDGNPHTLPDGGIDAVLQDGVACLREGAAPTAASALMIVVSPERLGHGISRNAIRRWQRSSAAMVSPTSLRRFARPRSTAIR